MGTVRKRTGRSGSITYTAQIRMKGQPTVAKTFKRKKDAERWVLSTEAAMLEGREFRTVEARRRTVGHLVDRYITHIAPLKKDAGNRKLHLTWWADFFGDLCLSDMTPARISEGRDKLLQTITRLGTPASPAYVCLHLASLSHACTVAVREWGWLESNPVKKVTRPKKPAGRTRFLNEDELKRLMEACDGSNHPHIKTIVTVALATGMRQGEILGLTWSAVDFELSRVTLRHTKNGEVRVVPLAWHAAEALKAHGRVRRLGSDLVFPGRTTRTGEIKPVSIQWAWGKVREAAQLEDFVFHDLRHTAASYLAMNGETMLQIAAVLGHKTMAMVKRYAHLSPASSASSLNAMADRFLTGTDGPDEEIEATKPSAAPDLGIVASA